MSEVSLSSYITSRTMVRSPDVMSQFSHRTTPSPIPQAGPSRLLPPLSKDRPPQTPTKRSYHVTNESASIIHSPPPAYRSPQKESALGDVDEDLVLPPAMVNTEDEPEEPEEESDLHALTSSRLSVLPPRLSLHQDTLSDLSNWSESLFSIIPSTPPKPGILENSNHAPPPPPPPPGSSNITPKRSNNRRTSVIPAHATSNSSSHIRQRQLQKPIPLQVRDERLTLPPSPGPPSMLSSSASSSPLWHEVYNLVSSPGPGSTSPGPSPLFTPSTPGPVISPVTSDESAHDNDELQVDFSRDKENRDSNMSTMTVTPATIVRRVSVVRRVRANVIQSPPRDADLQMPVPNISSASSDDVDDKESIRSARSNSPVSTDSNSSESSVANSTTTCATGSGSFDSRPQTLTLKETQKWKASGLLTSKSDEMPYVESSPQPSPLVGHFDHTIITTAAIRDYRDNEPVLARPSIVIDNIATELEEPSPWSAASTVPSPSTPAQRYPGWVTAVVRPLKKFINERLDPNDIFTELQEIAEGDSGSVYSARVVASPSEDGDTTFVAIKQVALLPSGSQKLVDLERELKLMKQLHHPQILSMDELYVDLVDDALWIRMELMDRSLADVLNLVDEGVEVLETHIAQFASDVSLLFLLLLPTHPVSRIQALKALSYLQIQEIAHRDIRSDNLLINGAGVVKLADFSHAVKVTRTNPMRSDPAGVIFWQAPEMRSAPYNALKVDVWGLGATAWELAQAAPPFAEATGASQLAERWPPLDQPADYSRSFHDFLQLCSEPSSSRPDPDDLLNVRQLRVRA
ncbi:hypothetical protein PHLCEN_2v887 [Hermanssonia centrifuga]|uniref:Protein kinase domain-containing protein n=1 Tax=Hermanssonia centrifuga TaxID=98765 RepID=A0A2R6S4V5_9APHY|nr:hypothetical protein PHLCEN_2v887 [Hermanssonia centrifuga]